MMYKAKVAVCSEIRTKYSTQSEHYVEFFLMLNLVVPKETARLEKVNKQENGRFLSNGPFYFSFILYDLIVNFVWNLVKLEQGHKHGSCDSF